MTGNRVEYRLCPAAAAGPVSVEAREPVLPLCGSLALAAIFPPTTDDDEDVEATDDWPTPPPPPCAAKASASFMAARRVRMKTRVVTGGQAPLPFCC